MKNIEKLVNEKAKIGMELILGDKTLKCVNTETDSYGVRYIFDNGISWTKSNIVSNLKNAILQGKAFGII
jgi:cyclopropane fatty-acyl-phospholipid synthase-like methyltransferase